MSHRIDNVSAFEILDSRSRPTVQVTVRLGNGIVATAGVPSGASTGSREAVELRDGDPSRYRGAGVIRAVANVNTEINSRLSSRSWMSLAEVDEALIALDGTASKGRLGANAIVGTSMAVARAMAVADDVPLYRWLAPDREVRLPVPHFNVINGGVHARNRLQFQEFMIAPLAASSFADAVRAGSEIYQRLRDTLTEAGLGTGLGDEGGFAPELSTPEEALEILVRAIEGAGYDTGPSGVAIALDPAASEIREPDGRYRYGPDEVLTSNQMIDRYEDLIERFPIWSIEDGLAEDDDAGWEDLTRRLGRRMQVMGDDNFVTNPTIIRDAIDRGIGNAALIKVNQIGTVTETLEAIAVCQSAGYRQMISHRSGETTDAFISDLAVACGCGQLKSGAPARGERVAKYNRLLEIEAELTDAPYGIDRGRRE